MGKEYRVRTFRSGNSVALRLPKALGIAEGREMTVREEEAGLLIAPVEAPPRHIKGDWIGSMPWLQPLSGDGDVDDDRKLDWDGAKLGPAGG